MSILDEIITCKKREVAKQQKKISIQRLIKIVHKTARPADFKNALKKNGSVGIVAEIKKASPSAGVIREDFDAVEIANIYKNNGASAISVLTDKEYFQGDIEYLKQVREAVDLPLLRKDFIIDPYQIVEARVHGADTVLLILNVLSKDHCQELVATAREYDLDYLIEVHTIKELERALCEDYPLVGINNRDLQTFTVDLATTEKLTKIIPDSITVISESGIKNREDIERLSRCGIDAVLIGETLMRQDNIGEMLKSLTDVPKCGRK